MRNTTIFVHRAHGDSITLEAPPGRTLAQSLWLWGDLPAPPLCSGLGHCGRCRVRFLSQAPPPLPTEIQTLAPEALQQGWRLACRHVMPLETPTVALEIPEIPTPRRDTGDISGVPLALAVDLGTTSLHWRAFSREGVVSACGEATNPQMGAGSEVMSRLATAARPEGKKRLAELVRTALRHTVAHVPGPVTEICVAANTAMTCILLEKDCSGLSHAPYHLQYAGNTTERLPELPPLYIPPLLAPFVGGDISAGLAAVEAAYGPEYPYLLADLGTNGELALVLSPRETLLASVPLGPALEGIGLTFGDMAGPGAVTAFAVTPSGLQATVRGDTPQRICGTGYLSLIQQLLRVGLLTDAGRFAVPASPLGRRLAAGLIEEKEPRLPLPGGMYLSAADVEEILKVKAAFSLALEHLLHGAALSAARLRHIFLAGALGEHVPPDVLESLGFLPPGAGARLICVGNSSLAGAQLLIREPVWRERLAVRTLGCTALDLASAPSFATEYLRHMRFG